LAYPTEQAGPLRLFRLIPIAIFILFSAPTANAETSIYGTAMLTTFNNGDTGGFTGGAFYNFKTSSRLTAGIDGRLSYAPGNKGGNAELGALRISFIPRSNPLRPYLQIGGGVVSETGNPYRRTTGALEILGGLDIRLTKNFDLRAVDYGAAAGSRFGYAFLNAGIVYHFQPAKHP
jgi:hypothetical protein